MSATYELKATARTRVGKGAARTARREGLVPAVIYGDKKAPLPINISYKESFMRLHAGGFLTTVCTIDVDGEKHRVIPRDYQLDPVRDFLIHVDFLRVSAGATLDVGVPVHFINEAASPGMKRDVAHSRAGDLLNAFDLVSAADTMVSDYSAGMTKKICLASAMIHSPRILVLDEPFESVDPVSSANLKDIL
ncbi:MAG TPA: 50S ribosomal protein L25/general stress protein Ctc, partial [Kaistiaceae bacterium]|nr:50S ribosomal protein L25/general stress protein Ctc [Kaistiaceae bacterium]